MIITKGVMVNNVCVYLTYINLIPTKELEMDTIIIPVLQLRKQGLSKVYSGSENGAWM